MRLALALSVSVVGTEYGLLRHGWWLRVRRHCGRRCLWCDRQHWHYGLASAVCNWHYALWLALALLALLLALWLFVAHVCRLLVRNCDYWSSVVGWHTEVQSALTSWLALHEIGAGIMVGIGSTGIMHYALWLAL